MKKRTSVPAKVGGVPPSPSVLQGFTPSLYIFSRGK
nr:MAG TPA: hypothetical protein [Caudoviricetes sp.]